MTDAPPTEEVTDGAGDGEERILLIGGGATGWGAAKVVAELVVDVRGGGDNAANALVVVCVGTDGADWKSSKSSSTAAALLCIVLKLLTAACEVPFEG